MPVAAGDLPVFLVLDGLGLGLVTWCWYTPCSLDNDVPLPAMPGASPWVSGKTRSICCFRALFSFFFKQSFVQCCVPAAGLADGR